MRDAYESTLDENAADEYREAFARAVRNRLPRFALSSTTSAHASRGRPPRGRDPDRVLRLELRLVARPRLPARPTDRALARALRDAFRHGRGEHDLLPPADAEGRPGLGRPLSAELPLRDQGQPVHHAHEAADRSRPGARPLPRAARAAARDGQARSLPLGSPRNGSTETTSASQTPVRAAAGRATASSSVTRAGSTRTSTRFCASTASRSRSATPRIARSSSPSSRRTGRSCVSTTGTGAGAATTRGWSSPRGPSASPGWRSGLTSTRTSTTTGRASPCETGSS